MLRAALLGVAALGVIAVAPAAAAPAPPVAYSCRGYPSTDVVRQIKSQVEGLRRLEREAADRTIGLDTRPYDWLLEQTRNAQTAIADPAALSAEAELHRCRNFIRPVRADCATAAAALVRVIEELTAGDASRDAKQAHAQAAPRCERSLGLMPLETRLRVAE